MRFTVEHETGECLQGIILFRSRNKAKAVTYVFVQIVYCHYFIKYLVQR